MSQAAVVIGVVAAAAPAGWAGALAARRLSGEERSAPLAAAVAASALVFASAALIVPASPILLLSVVLGWTLLLLAAVDIACFRLPDVLTLPLIAAGLAASLALPGAPWLDHLAGAAAGGAALAILAWAWPRLRGVEGMGLGDAKLLAAGGAWLGWRALPSVVLIACAAAFAWYGLMFLARGRQSLRRRMAFGAPLALAIWIVWLVGPLAL
jgi:leader peptidase (prepilin peptidase)/N-methyltransferase